MTTDQAGLRSAQGDALTLLILESTSGPLEAVLDNSHLEEKQLLLVLRRTDLDPSLLRRVVDSSWIGSYQVKAAVVANPHTPKITALNLVKYLFWRDLAKIMNGFQVEPAVRRLAEVSLRDRMQEISLGERVALARMAPRELIKVLRLDPNERIFSALLENSRLTEDDLLLVANRAQTPQHILLLVARNQRWNSRSKLRLALVRHPRMPTAAALPLLAGLLEHDLNGLLESPGLNHTIRSAAARLLTERRDRVGGS